MAGLFNTIKLAATLVLALPAALAGLQFLVRGDTLTGGILLVLAVTLVIAQQRVPLPSDIPGLLAKQVVGSVAATTDSDADETDGDETDTDDRS